MHKAVSLCDLLSADAERAEYQTDWDRQLSTAQLFLDRFQAGLDTQLLADEVGMGKTYVAMAAISGLLLNSRHDRSTRRAILVTPSSAVLRAKWEQELRSFDERYVLPKKKERPRLRPLVVRSYWELVANLHDYENEKIERIHEPLMLWILDTFWNWGVKREYVSRRMSRFPRLEDYDGDCVDALVFSSSYSLAGWYSFLDEQRARGEGQIRSWMEGLRQPSEAKASKAAVNELKSIFKEFAAKQDHYEPNVLILGMSALQRGRTDQVESQRFSTFILGVLLKGQWESTRSSLVRALQPSNLFLGRINAKLLKEYADANLYQTRSSVQESIVGSSTLGVDWEALRRDPSPSRAKAFFKELMSEVVCRKLAQSGIELAVVDEAHNWKSGANGASDFQRVFSPSIPCKLLMSATPFQLAEGELRTLFGYTSTPDSPARLRIESLFSPSGIVNRCLAASDEFQRQWDRLATSIDSFAAIESALADYAPGTACTGTDVIRSVHLSLPPTAPAIAKDFCSSALAYAEAIDEFGGSLGKVVIRHLKPRKMRSFHAGREFMATLESNRSVLYRVEGMSRAEDAFIHFLAMRLDQHVRSRPDDPSSTNAHLMEGLTSSKSAFLGSAAAVDAVAEDQQAVVVLAHAELPVAELVQRHVHVCDLALDDVIAGDQLVALQLE